MLITSKYGEALSVLDSHGHTVAVRISKDVTGQQTWVDGRWLTRQQVCLLAEKYRLEMPVATIEDARSRAFEFTA